MPSDEQQARNRWAMQRSWGGSGIGWTMVADVVTGTFLWGGIGWLVDRWLGTDPWVMIVGFVVGNAIGIYAASLHMRRMQRDAPAPGTTPAPPPDDDPSSDW